MGKKYLDTKEGSLESSVLGVWQTAIEEGDARMDGRTKQYKEHRKKLESARSRREEKKVNKEEIEIDEKVEYVEYEFKNKNDAVKAKAYFDKQQMMSFDVNDDDITNGELAVDAGKEDMSKHHKEIMKMFKPKVLTQEETELDEFSIEEIDLFELDDEMFEAEMKKKSAADRMKAKKKRDKWKKTSGGKKSALKSKKRADKVRKGTVKVDKSKSKVAKKRAKIYAGDDVELDEGKMKELHGYIEAGKSAEWIAKKMGVDVKTIKALMSGYNEEVKLDEASGDKEAYQKFFNATLKKFKVSSPAELKGDQKKKFYDYIDKNWEGDNEKAEQVKEFKVQSMRDALAKVWGIDEHKGTKPHKHPHEEDTDEEHEKRTKTETGKKPAAINLKPKIDDK